MKKRVLVLYTELAGYSIAGLSALAKHAVEIHLVRLPVNAEAPFSFEFDQSLKVYNRKEQTDDSLLKLAAEINPDLILCSGWNDKGYLAVCKQWNSRIPVVLAMDNKWKGTLKQQLARVVSPFTIRRSFNACWVPGMIQKEYARKLGFRENKISTGFYTCDTERFHLVYEGTRAEKAAAFPHVFIYAGRYYDFKGVTEMWSAFARLKKETQNDWKLVCLGVGDIQPAAHPDITHEGFVQPAELEKVMKRAGVFILPSRVEPWGVVVQEFGAAGFPLLLSDAVGAAEAFLLEGKNGFQFTACDESSLLAAMKQVAQLPDGQLKEMGVLSNQLALKNTPEIWAQTLMSFIPNNSANL